MGLHRQDRSWEEGVQVLGGYLTWQDCNAQTLSTAWVIPKLACRSLGGKGFLDHSGPQVKSLMVQVQSDPWQVLRADRSLSSPKFGTPCTRRVGATEHA